MNPTLKFIFDAIVDRTYLTSYRDTVSLHCENADHADKVLEALERLGDLAEEMGYFSLEETE